MGSVNCIVTVKLVRIGGTAGDWLGFNNLWLELLGGDFESVNAQLTPGGFELTTGNFDPTNIDDAEDFQLSREESNLQFGPSLTGEEVDRAI